MHVHLIKFQWQSISMTEPYSRYAKQFHFYLFLSSLNLILMLISHENYFETIPLVFSMIKILRRICYLQVFNFIVLTILKIEL